MKDISIRISADASAVVRAMGQAETAISETGQAATRAGGQVEGLGDRMDRATARAAMATERFRGAMARATGGSGAFGRGLQNAGFQVADFAGQVNNGTSAAIALGQQLPQLLGGFGVLGAVIGAAVAIFGPMATTLAQNAAASGTLTESFGTLQPVAEAVVVAFQRLADAGAAMGTWLAENLDRVLIIAGTAATFFAGRWVASIVAANLATMTFAGSLAFLRAALIRTGIGAAIVGAGELVFQFSRLVQATGSFGAAMGLLGDVGREVWTRINLAIDASTARMAAAWEDLRADALDVFDGMLVSAANFGDRTAAIFQGAYDAAVAIWGSLPGAIGDFAFQAANGLISGVEAMLNGVVTLINAFIEGLNSALDLLPDWATGGGPLRIGALGGVQLGRVDNPFAGGANEAATAATDAFNSAMQGTYLNAPDLGLRAAAGDARGRADGFREAAGMLDQGRGGPLESVLAIRDVLAGMRDENLTLPGVLSGDAAGDAGGAGGMGRLQTTLDQAKGMMDEFKNYTQMTLGEQLGTWGSYFGDLASLVGSGNEKILAVSKAFAAGEALVNAWRGYNQVLADPTLPFFAKIAAAGKVLAAGFGAVNAIKGIGSGGSGGRVIGGRGAAGGGSTAGAATQAAAPAPSTFVNVSLVGGNQFGGDQVRTLITEINKAIENGATIRGIRAV